MKDLGIDIININEAEDLGIDIINIDRIENLGIDIIDADKVKNLDINITSDIICGSFFSLYKILFYNFFFYIKDYELFFNILVWFFIIIFYYFNKIKSFFL